jgi:hypothetical protein
MHIALACQEIFILNKNNGMVAGYNMKLLSAPGKSDKYQEYKNGKTYKLFYSYPPEIYKSKFDNSKYTFCHWPDIDNSKYI